MRGPDKLPILAVAAFCLALVLSAQEAAAPALSPEAMEEFIGSQRSQVLERRDLLVRHFDERIARLGENAVLFDE